ncbi:hypothetical protein PHYPSEUDO_001501 [Phytophthora pseudosyringae]|uniref:Uncharacterized protein n=1 Tax=Phytophthora pseudosyringae TaxID=221518 RepID=A0A8T1VVX5_9STRA|nr:hypothetical protein PHYPSEUDO_001501 [Phytophthora pseudosyringae]
MPAVIVTANANLLTMLNVYAAMKFSSTSERDVDVTLSAAGKLLAFWVRSATTNLYTLRESRDVGKIRTVSETHTAVQLNPICSGSHLLQTLQLCLSAIVLCFVQQVSFMRTRKDNKC